MVNNMIIDNTPSSILSNTLKRLDGAYAHATLRAYRTDFATFIAHCEMNSLECIPATPEAVSSYINALVTKDLKSASIRRAIAGISTIHRLNRFPDPTKDPEVTIEMRRMHRQLGRASHQAQGINKDLLEKMITLEHTSLRDIRNRALILLAYDTLCRRSELTSLNIEDIKRSNTDKGQLYRILLKRSKTDQDGLGRWLTVSEKTAEAIDCWLAAAKITSGSLFRGINNSGAIGDRLRANHINRIYKRLAQRANLSTDFIQGVSGHSFRVGAAQDLLASGASLPIIMKLGRWNKSDTVMRYVEQANI